MYTLDEHTRTLYAREMVVKNVENQPLFWTKPLQKRFKLFLQTNGFKYCDIVCVRNKSYGSSRVTKLFNI